MGSFDAATLNLTAGRSPRGGWVDVLPRNGSALVTTFVISSGNWTDDADSYPLTYLFQYSSSGGAVPVEAEYKTTPNASTILVGSVIINTTPALSLPQPPI